MRENRKRKVAKMFEIGLHCVLMTRRRRNMALIKKPVNGMKDILPEEMQIRDYVIQVIKDTYRGFGFTSMTNTVHGKYQEFIKQTGR